MEEKKYTKISVSTFLLIITIIALGVMGFFLYKINDEKTKATEQVSELNNQVKTLENSVNSLQRTIEETSNTNKIDTSTNVTETKKEDEQSKNSTSFTTLSGVYKAEVKIDDNWTGDVSLSLQDNGEFSYSNDPRTNAGVSGHYTFKDNIITLYKELSHPNDSGGPYSTSGTITLKINTDGSITDENLHERNISVTLNKVEFELNGTYQWINPEGPTMTYIFSNGNFTYTETATSKGTYQISGNKVKIRFDEEYRMPEQEGIIDGNKLILNDVTLTKK